MTKITSKLHYSKVYQPMSPIWILIIVQNVHPVFRKSHFIATNTLTIYTTLKLSTIAIFLTIFSTGFFLKFKTPLQIQNPLNHFFPLSNHSHLNRTHSPTAITPNLVPQMGQLLNFPNTWISPKPSCVKSHQPDRQVVYLLQNSKVLRYPIPI